MRALRSGALGIFINPSKGLTQIQGVIELFAQVAHRANRRIARVVGGKDRY